MNTCPACLEDFVNYGAHMERCYGFPVREDIVASLERGHPPGGIRVPPSRAEVPLSEGEGDFSTVAILGSPSESGTPEPRTRKGSSPATPPRAGADWAAAKSVPSVVPLDILKDEPYLYWNGEEW